MAVERTSATAHLGAFAKMAHDIAAGIADSDLSAAGLSTSELHDLEVLHAVLGTILAQNRVVTEVEARIDAAAHQQAEEEQQVTTNRKEAVRAVTTSQGGRLRMPSHRARPSYLARPSNVYDGGDEYALQVTVASPMLHTPSSSPMKPLTSSIGRQLQTPELRRPITRDDIDETMRGSPPSMVTPAPPVNTPAAIGHAEWGQEGGAADLELPSLAQLNLALKSVDDAKRSQSYQQLLQKPYTLPSRLSSPYMQA